MTSFERRQRLLDLLRRQPGITIAELSKELHVSRGTIRNDLTALEQAGEVTRVRGGAVPEERPSSPSRAPRQSAQTGQEAGQRIARHAAELVEDGDSILLDASATVLQMAPFLAERRHLTIITPGIEVGLALSRNPEHTIVLLGGNLQSQGSMVLGHLAEKNLVDLHVKTAFISCSGLAIDVGLTEHSLQEAELKRSMLRAADRAVALVDAARFGRQDLAAFADVAQISHLITDDTVAPQLVEQLRARCAALTICGESSVETLAPCVPDRRQFRIGFANLCEEKVLFSVDVRRGIERAVEAAGHIDLITADNSLSGEVALQVADYLIGCGVDLAIEYQIDETASGVIMEKFRRAKIPVVAVDIPMVGAIYFGVDNYRAGHMAGLALGEWVAAHWHGRPERLIVLEEPRPGPLPAARIQGQLDGVEEVLGRIPPDRIMRLNSGNTSQTSEAEMLAALRSLPDERRLAVICFNDDAAIGALAAARRLGREAHVVIVGQGADRRVCRELRQPDSRIIGSTAFWPEKYGERLVAVALQILRGEPVPLAVYMDHVFITAKNLEQYYPR
jgi:ribose transport system substrate-binding protein